MKHLKVIGKTTSLLEIVEIDNTIIDHKSYIIYYEIIKLDRIDQKKKLNTFFARLDLIFKIYANDILKINHGVFKENIHRYHIELYK